MKIKSKIFYLYAALVVIYAGLVLIPAPAKATLTRYHIGADALRELDATFIILAAIIWFAAFYGYYKLQRYSQLIKRGKDGRHIAKLSYGLLALAIGFPLSSIISSLLIIIAQHNPGFATSATIIENYTDVVYPLIAFIFISIGARGLCDLSKKRPRLRSFNVVVLVATILGVLFCYLITRSHHDVQLAYHMSPGLVMLTLAIPYVYIWFLGLFALAEMQVYSSTVAGIVYRKGWNLLAAGLGAVILLSIVLQYLTTLSSWLVGLSLSWVLVLLYVLLLLLAAAYILVALGAKKLTRIEEA